MNNQNYYKCRSIFYRNIVGPVPDGCIKNKELNSFAIRHTNRGAYVGAKKFLKDTGLLPGANVAQNPVKAGQYIAITL